jgi:NAD(P)H-nitrite reductase large subunit
MLRCRTDPGGELGSKTGKGCGGCKKPVASLMVITLVMKTRDLYR